MSEECQTLPHPDLTLNKHSYVHSHGFLARFNLK